MSVFLTVDLYKLFTIVSKSLWYIVWKTKNTHWFIFFFFIFTTMCYIKADSKPLVVKKYSIYNLEQIRLLANHNEITEFQFKTRSFLFLK